MSQRSMPQQVLWGLTRGWDPVRRQGHAPTRESTARSARIRSLSDPIRVERAVARRIGSPKCLARVVAAALKMVHRHHPPLSKAECCLMGNLRVARASAIRSAPGASAKPGHDAQARMPRSYRADASKGSRVDRPSACRLTPAMIRATVQIAFQILVAALALSTASPASALVGNAPAT